MIYSTILAIHFLDILVEKLSGLLGEEGTDPPDVVQEKRRSRLSLCATRNSVVQGHTKVPGRLGCSHCEAIYGDLLFAGRKGRSVFPRLNFR